MSARHAIVAALALASSVFYRTRRRQRLQWTPTAARILGEQGRRRGTLGDHPEPVRLLRHGTRLFLRRPGPVFIWCEKTGENFLLRHRRAQPAVPLLRERSRRRRLHSPDWSLISDQVSLPLSFFIPEAETCDLRRRPERPERRHCRSYWNCGGSDGPFEFRMFANGTASQHGDGFRFDFDALEEGCRHRRLADGSYLDVEYSPSRDH